MAPGALAAKVDSDFAGVPYERSGEGAHGEDGADLLNGSWTSFAQCWRRCQAAMACLREPTSMPPMEPEALKRMCTPQTRDELLCAEWVERELKVSGN